MTSSTNELISSSDREDNLYKITKSDAIHQNDSSTMAQDKSNQLQRFTITNSTPKILSQIRIQILILIYENQRRTCSFTQ